MNLKLLSTIGLVYTILLVYASLMPFDFSFGSDMNGFRYFLSYWPINPGARISGSDLISNLVLYMPLGWIIAVRLRLGNSGLLLAMIVAGLICSAISMGVEFLQAFSVSRISSATDWLVNTISGLAGASIGVICGKPLWMKGIRWLKQSWETRPVIIATVIFAGLLMADAFSPYMPTILMKQVWQSLKSSNVGFVQGLAMHPWHWWVVHRVLVYLILTLLFAGCIKQKPVSKPFLPAACFVALFSFFIEIGKLFIVSRSFSIANVITSWAGCFLAIFIGYLFKGRVGVRRRLELSICFILFYVFYLAWFPFNFNFDYERIQRVMPSPIRLLPLYDYAMGATLNHARLFMQSLFLLGILTYIFRARFSWFENSKYRIGLAVFFCGMLGVLQESGQLFLASRTPSATDIYCFALGGGIGAWIKRPQIFI